MKTSSETGRTGRTRRRSQARPTAVKNLTLERFATAVAAEVQKRLDTPESRFFREHRALKAETDVLPKSFGSDPMAAKPTRTSAGQLRDAIGEIDNELCEHQKALDELVERLSAVSTPAPPPGDTVGMVTGLGAPTAEATHRCLSLASSIRRNTALVRNAIDRLEV